MGNFITKIKRGFENLFTWLPIIWRDRNYDYEYIYKLLQKKLLLTLNELKKDHYDEEEYQIEACLMLLDKLIDNKYGEGIYDAFDAKWGNASFVKNQENIIELTYFHAKTSEEKEQNRKEFLACVELEEKERARDRVKLFNLLSENIESWWN